MNSGNIEIRILTETDVKVFRKLRLEALEREPQAFLTSAEDERARPLAEVAERLKPVPNGGFTLGAFLDDRLVGMVGLARDPREKVRHKGLVWGMYVSEAARGQGAGRALLAALIERAKSYPDLEQLTLMVVTEQRAARALYASLGFESYGLEHRALKLGERYLDEELMVLRLRR